MAETGRINLIKEFTKVQKEHDLIILTTFNFDAPFFDIYLLDYLQRRNPTTDIFILMDGDEYNRSYPNFTRHTGCRYNLIPVFANAGVFHPKLFLFFSRRNRIITTYLGSPNITLAGFASNAEVVTKISSPLNPINSVVLDSIEFLSLLVEKGYVQNRKLAEALRFIKDRIGDRREDETIKFFHNLDEPIFPRLINELKQPPQSVFMIAPFWSPNTKILENLNQNDTLVDLTIALQSHNHNLAQPELYQNYCKKNQIQLAIYKADFAKNRRIHSKLIAFNGEVRYLLTGSANITESALLNTCDSGNFEVSVLIRNASDELITPIKMYPIKKLEEINSTLARYSEPGKPKTLKVFYVDYDIVTSALSLGFEKSEQETKVTVIFKEGPPKELTVINNERVEEHCEKIPIEVIFERDEVFTRRRVFYDSEYIYRRLSRGRISLPELSKNILTDVDLSAEGLLQLIHSLSLSKIEEEPPSRDVQERKKDKKERFHMPSREIDVSRNKKIINKFIEISRLLHSFKQEQREAQEEGYVDDNIDDGMNLPNHAQRFLDEEEERYKVCSQLLKAINEIYLYQVQEAEDINSSMVSTMALFSRSFISILVPIHFDYRLLEEFVTFLGTNLKISDLATVDFDLRKYLFMNLALINYNLELDAGYMVRFFSFLDSLFVEKEIVTREFIEECKEYVTMVEGDIDNEYLILQIGQLASLVPSGATVDDDVIKFLKKAKEYEDDAGLLFFKGFLENIFTRWALGSKQTRDEIQRLAGEIHNKQKDILIEVTNKRR